MAYWGNYFTLGFTTFNMVVSLLMIVAVAWAVIIGYSRFSEILKQELLARMAII